jgi:hypothetical protein
LFGVEKATGFLALFFRLIPYILLGILLYILIKFFIGANARSLLQAQKSKGAVSLSEEERIIKNEDITQLIKEALKVGDYRLAVRFYYLYILQLMTEKELIVWQLQKTNDDYIEELIKAKLQGPFKDLTYLYDYIWYGNFPIDQASFLTAEKKFLSLKKNIEAHG